jgi:hypothetical protein
MQHVASRRQSHLCQTSSDWERGTLEENSGAPPLLVITSYIHVTVCVAYNLFVGLDAVLYEALSGAIGS